MSARPRANKSDRVSCLLHVIGRVMAVVVPHHLLAHADIGCDIPRLDALEQPPRHGSVAERMWRDILAQPRSRAGRSPGAA